MIALQERLLLPLLLLPLMAESGAKSYTSCCDGVEIGVRQQPARSANRCAFCRISLQTRPKGVRKVFVLLDVGATAGQID